jgi:hypothetical protein
MDMNDYAEGSAWLKREHLEEGSITATVETVNTMQGNFGKQIVIETEKFKYSMTPGHPNIKKLIEGFGQDSDNWAGRDIEFSADSYVDKKGEMKETILTTPQTVVVGKTAAEAHQMMNPGDGNPVATAQVPPPPTPKLDISEQELGF